MIRRWKAAVSVLLLASCVAANAATLTNWSLLSSNFEFRLRGDSNLPYVIQRSTDLVRWTMHLRSLAGGEERLIATPTAQEHSRSFFRTVQTNELLFGLALKVRHGMDLYGYRLTVDSFDSATNTRSTNRRWDPAKRRANGNIACNDTITNATLSGRMDAYGRADTGPFGAPPLGTNGRIGSLAWHTSSNTGIQPGYFSEDANAGFPDTKLPQVAWSALPAPVGGVTTFNSSGNYYLPSGTLDGKILIAATNVILRVDGNLLLSGTDGITIQSNASLILYLNCTNAQFTGNGIVNHGTAGQCYIFGTSMLKSLTLGSNNETTCVIYAPQADLLLHRGGLSDVDFSGAIVANSMRFTGHYNIHYDESLGQSEPLLDF